VPPQQVNSEIPGALAEIVMRCLSKQAADRYATGNDLADALIAFLAQAGGGSPLRAASLARASVTATK